jgi:hypothetical protein
VVKASALRRPRLTRALLVAFGAAALAASGCSSTSASTSDAGGGGAGASDAESVGCAGYGDTYVANLAKPGQNGVYTFTLVQATPAPPAQAGNVWTLKIADKTGASPALSQVIVYPFMPLMGHPSDQTPTVALNPDGTFQATDIDLFMPGIWTVTVKVAQPVDGGAVGATPLIVDQGVYTFCI